MSDPISPLYRAQMNALAAELDAMFNGAARGKDRKTGFVLLVFPFGDDAKVNYIANGDRRDVLVALKAIVARFEGQPELKGRG